MAGLRVLQGRADEAIEWAENALRLNPYPPGWYYWDLGFAYYAAGRYAEAVTVLRKEEVGRLPAKRILAASLAQLGRTAEAHEEACRFLEINPGFLVSRWAAVQPFKRDEIGSTSWRDISRRACHREPIVRPCDRGLGSNGQFSRDTSADVGFAPQAGFTYEHHRAWIARDQRLKEVFH